MHPNSEASEFQSLSSLIVTDLQTSILWITGALNTALLFSFFTVKKKKKQNDWDQINVKKTQLNVQIDTNNLNCKKWWKISQI